MSKQRTGTAIRFPADLHAELTRAAEERDISVDHLVVRAVADFLPRLIPVDRERSVCGRCAMAREATG